MNLAASFAPAVEQHPLQGLEPTDEPQLDLDDDCDDDLEHRSEPVGDDRPSGPRILGPVRRLPVVEQDDAPEPPPGRDEEQVALAALRTEVSLSETELAKRGAIRALSVPGVRHYGEPRWRLPEPRQGWMRPGRGDRRDDCARYSDCLHLAATSSREAHASCPKACSHFVAVSREQRIAEASFQRERA